MKHVVIVHDKGNQQPTLTNRYQQKVQQKAQAKLLNFLHIKTAMECPSFNLRVKKVT